MHGEKPMSGCTREPIDAPPRSDSKGKIGGPLSFALTNGDEDKLLGLFT